MKSVTKLINLLCRYVSYLSMIATVLIMILIVVDVVCRTVFNNPITGSYDIVTLFMTVLVFSSWSYTQTQHGHVHVTMFVSKMPRICRFIAFGITSVLSTGFMAYMTAAAYQQIFANLSNNSHGGTIPIPYWPFTVFECVAFAIFTLTLLLDTIKTFGALVSTELADEVQSYWV